MKEIVNLKNEKAIILKEYSYDYEIQFINSKNKYKCRKTSVEKGTFSDFKKEEQEFLNTIWNQNCGDKIKILRKSDKKQGYIALYECEFLNHPFIVLARKEHIIKGSVDNPILYELDFIGHIFYQNCGDSLRVIRKTNKKDVNNHHYLYECEFIKYHQIVFAKKTSILEGNVENPGFPWKSKEKFEKYLKDLNKKITYKELSILLNRSDNTLYHIIKEFNLQKYILKEDIVSIPEWEVRQYCRQIENSFLEDSDWDVLKNYEIDIYSPKLKLGFEFNGDYWHSDEFCLNRYGITSKEKDLLKMNLAKKYGIDLYFIWEHDWKNRKEVVKRYIKLIISKYLKNE